MVLRKSTEVFRYSVNTTEYPGHTHTCFRAALQLSQLNPNGRVIQPGVPRRPGYGVAVKRLLRRGAVVAVMTSHSCCTATCTVSSLIKNVYTYGGINFSYSDPANPFSFPILAHESKRGAASQSQRCSWRCSKCCSAAAGEAASARLLQPVPESCSWIASVSAVALANDLALRQKLELLYQLSNIILPSIQYSCKFFT